WPRRSTTSGRSCGWGLRAEPDGDERPLPLPEPRLPLARLLLGVPGASGGSDPAPLAAAGAGGPHARRPGVAAPAGRTGAAGGRSGGPPLLDRPVPGAIAPARRV